MGTHIPKSHCSSSVRLVLRLLILYSAPGFKHRHNQALAIKIFKHGHDLKYFSLCNRSLWVGWGRGKFLNSIFLWQQEARLLLLGQTISTIGRPGAWPSFSSAFRTCSPMNGSTMLIWPPKFQASRDCPLLHSSPLRKTRSHAPLTSHIHAMHCAGFFSDRLSIVPDHVKVLCFT